MRKPRKKKFVTAQESAYKQVANEGIAPSRMRKRGYLVVGVAECDMPRFDREQAMAEARSQVENNPFVSGLVQCSVDNIVRTGFRLVMNTKDKVWNKENEAAWAEKCDFLDCRNIRPFWKLQRSWQYRKMVDGDVGVYHNNVDVGTDEFFIQTIEADRIRSKKFDYLDQGVEFDDLGMPLRYWIGPRPKDQLDVRRALAQGSPVSADDFFLYAHYPTERVDQLRGVSMLLPMFNTLKDIKEGMNAMLQKLKVSAFFALKTITKTGPTGLDWNGTETVKTNEDGKSRKTRSIVPGTIADLAAGEDIAEIESNSPNPEFEKFIRFTVRYACVQLGVPLEFALLDVGALNYSSMLAVREMAKRRFICEQQSLMVPSSKVFKSWQANMVENDELKPPKSLKTNFHSHRWLTPPWPSLDSQKDYQAYGLALGFGLTTIKDILAESSTNTFEELVAQRAEEIKVLAAAGIPTTIGMPGSTPAAPVDEKSTESGGIE